MSTFLKRLVSVITLTAFILTSAWPWDLFIEKAHAQRPGLNNFNYSELAEKTGIIREVLTVDGFEMPSTYCEIKDTFETASAAKETLHSDDIAIIHIQDAHCDYAAQLRISSMLEYLNKKYGVDRVYMEGGAGEYDLSVFNTTDNGKIKQAVAENFMKNGELSGAEYYAVTNPGKVTLRGIEYPDLYMKNLNAYRDILPYRNDARRALDAFYAGLEGIKEAFLNGKLIGLYEKYRSYQSGKIGLEEYFRYLPGIMDDASLVGRFPNMAKLRDVITLEDGIDFKKAEAERDMIIKELEKKLSLKEIEELLVKFADFKSGNIDDKDFYGYLLRKADCICLDLVGYPNIEKYSEYIAKYRAINNPALFEEIENAASDTWNRCSEKPGEKEYFRWFKWLGMIESAVNAKLTKKDHDSIMSSKKDMDLTGLDGFIALHGGKGVEAGDIANLQKYLAGMEKFYACSFERDKAFIYNLESDIEGISDEKRRETKAVVLITGGFHADNLASLMREKGIPYISLMPKFTSDPDIPNPYYEILGGGFSDEFMKFAKVLGMGTSTIAIADFGSSLARAARGNEADLLEIKAWLEIRSRELGGVRVASGGRDWYFDIGGSGDVETVDPAARDVSGFVEIDATSLSTALLAKAETGKATPGVGHGQAARSVAANWDVLFDNPSLGWTNKISRLIFLPSTVFHELGHFFAAIAVWVFSPILERMGMIRVNIEDKPGFMNPIKRLGYGNDLAQFLLDILYRGNLFGVTGVAKELGGVAGNWAAVGVFGAIAIVRAVWGSSCLDPWVIITGYIGIINVLSIGFEEYAKEKGTGDLAYFGEHEVYKRLRPEFVSGMVKSQKGIVIERIKRIFHGYGYSSKTLVEFINKLDGACSDHNEAFKRIGTLNNMMVETVEVLAGSGVYWKRSVDFFLSAALDVGKIQDLEQFCRIAGWLARAGVPFEVMERYFREEIESPRDIIMAWKVFDELEKNASRPFQVFHDPRDIGCAEERTKYIFLELPGIMHLSRQNVIEALEPAKTRAEDVIMGLEELKRFRKQHEDRFFDSPGPDFMKKVAKEVKRGSTREKYFLMQMFNGLWDKADELSGDPAKLRALLDGVFNVYGSMGEKIRFDRNMYFLNHFFSQLEKGYGQASDDEVKLRAKVERMIKTLAGRGYFDPGSAKFFPEVFNIQIISEIILDFGKHAPEALDIYMFFIEKGMVDTVPHQQSILPLMRRLAFVTPMDDINAGALTKLREFLESWVGLDKARADGTYYMELLERLFGSCRMSYIYMLEKAARAMGNEFNINTWLDLKEIDEVYYNLGPVFRETRERVSETVEYLVGNGCVRTDEGLKELVLLLKPITFETKMETIPRDIFNEIVFGYIRALAVNPDNYGKFIELMKSVKMGHKVSAGLKEALTVCIDDVIEREADPVCLDPGTVMYIERALVGKTSDLLKLDWQEQKRLEEKYKIMLKLHVLMVAMKGEALTEDELIIFCAAGKAFMYKGGTIHMVFNALKQAQGPGKLAKLIFDREMGMPSYRAYVHMKKRFKGTELENEFDDCFIQKMDNIKNLALRKIVYKEAMSVLVKSFDIGFMAKGNCEELRELINCVIDKISGDPDMGKVKQDMEAKIKQMFGNSFENITLAKNAIDSFTALPPNYVTMLMATKNEVFGSYLDVLRKAYEKGYYTEGQFGAWGTLIIEILDGAIAGVLDHELKKNRIGKAADALMGIYACNKEMFREPEKYAELRDRIKALFGKLSGSGEYDLITALGQAGFMSAENITFLIDNFSDINKCKEKIEQRIMTMKAGGEIRENITNEIMEHLFSRFPGKMGMTITRILKDLDDDNSFREKFDILYDSYLEDELYERLKASPGSSVYDHARAVEKLALIKSGAKLSAGGYICDMFSVILDKINEDKSGELARKILGVSFDGENVIFIDSGLERLEELIKMCERSSDSTFKTFSIGLTEVIYRYLANTVNVEDAGSLGQLNVDLLCSAICFRDRMWDDTLDTLFPAIFSSGYMAEDQIPAIKRFVRTLSYNRENAASRLEVSKAIGELSGTPIGRKMLDYDLFSRMAVSAEETVIGEGRLGAVRVYLEIFKAISAGKAPEELADPELYRCLTDDADQISELGTPLVTLNFMALAKAFERGLVDENNFGVFMDVIKLASDLFKHAPSVKDGSPDDKGLFHKIINDLIDKAGKDDIEKIRALVVKTSVLVEALSFKANDGRDAIGTLKDAVEVGSLTFENIGEWTDLVGAITGNNEKRVEILETLRKFAVAVKNRVEEADQTLKVSPRVLSPVLIKAIVEKHSATSDKRSLSMAFKALMVLNGDGGNEDKEKEIAADFERKYESSKGFQESVGPGGAFLAASQKYFPVSMSRPDGMTMILQRCGYRTLGGLRLYREIREALRLAGRTDLEKMIGDEFLLDLADKAKGHISHPLKFILHLAYRPLNEGLEEKDMVKFISLAGTVTKMALKGENDIKRSEKSIEYGFWILYRMLTNNVINRDNLDLVNDLFTAADNNKLSRDSFPVIDNMVERKMLGADNVGTMAKLFGMNSGVLSKVNLTTMRAGLDGSKMGMFSQEFMGILIDKFPDKFEEIWKQTEAIIDSAHGVNAEAGKNMDPSLGDMDFILGILKKMSVIADMKPSNTVGSKAGEMALMMLETMSALGRTGALNNGNIEYFGKIIENLMRVGDKNAMIQSFNSLALYVKTVEAACTPGGSAKAMISPEGLAGFTGRDDFNQPGYLDILTKIFNEWKGEFPANILGQLTGNVNLVSNYYNGKRPVKPRVDDYIQIVIERSSDGYVLDAIKYLTETERDLDDSVYGDYLRPEEVPTIHQVKEELRSKGIEALCDGITCSREKPLSWMNSVYAYLKLMKEVPKARGITFTEFWKVVANKDAKSPSRELIETFIFEKFYIAEDETPPDIQEQIMALSINLKNEMQRLYKKINRKELPPTTFREIRMFNVHFSEHYPREKEKGNIVRLFVLTAHNIYGRLIVDKETREAFLDGLLRAINQGDTLLGIAQMQVESEIFKDPGRFRELVDKTISYAHYKDINPALPGPGEDVPAKRKIRALIERASQVSNSLLLMLGGNRVMFRDVINDMYGEKDKEVIELSMNGFTRRRELFGMYVPSQKMDEEEISRYVDHAPDEKIEEALKAVCDIDARIAALDLEISKVDAMDPERETIVDRLNEEKRILNRFHDDWDKDGGAKERSTARWAVAMYLKHGDKWRDFFKWEDGVISKLARKAKADPGRKFFIVFNNIEVCPPWVRVLLNPVLWEKSVAVPVTGEELGIPQNLNMIFTMDKDADLKDPSFMDRHLVHVPEGVDDIDELGYLASKAVDPAGISGLSPQAVAKLKEKFDKVRKLELSEDAGVGLIDLIEIAKRVKGLMNDGAKLGEDELIERETYNYFHLRLKNRHDREKLKEAVIPGADINSPLMKPALSIDMQTRTIDFDGARVNMSGKFYEFCRSRTDLKTDDARIHGFSGYIVQELEKRMFAQIARAYKYANKAMQIEGPSGEGKTEIGKIFALVTEIDNKVNEKLVSVETDLSEFRGQVRPTRRGGQYYLYEPEYVRDFQTPGHLFLMNEINTNADSALYHWLYPEISGSRYKCLAEYAGEGDVIAKRLAIDQNNLWLFTVNPDTMDGRVPLPRSIACHLPVFYMATDDEDIPAFTEKILAGEIKDISRLAHDMKSYVEILSSLYIAVRSEKLKNNMESPQDITKRSIIDAANEMNELLKNKRKLSGRAVFRMAVEKCFINKWKSDKDKFIVRELAEKITKEMLEEEKVFEREIKPEEYDEMVKDGVKSPADGRFRPRMFFVDTATRDSVSFEREIAGLAEGAKTHDIIISFAHGKRRLIGGFVPSDEDEIFEEALKPLNAISRKFRGGLGIIPELIFEARMDPWRKHCGVFHNYNDLNPKVAPMLNGFLQTGKLETIENYVDEGAAEELLKSFRDSWETLLSQRDIPRWIKNALPSEYPLEEGAFNKTLSDIGVDLAKWFYSSAPANLDIIAVCSSVDDVNIGSRLGAAEFDRFRATNISRALDDKIVMEYIDKNIPVSQRSAKELILGRALECFTLHNDPEMLSKYDDRPIMSIKDLEAYVNVLKDIAGGGLRGDEFEKAVNDAAYYTMGISLRPEQRGKLKFVYDKEGLRKEIPSRGGALSLTENLALQLKLMGLARANNKADNFMPVIFEGEPGGGKTAACEEFAKREGLPIYKALMYQDIDIGEFLGRTSKKGEKFVLTTTEKEKMGDKQSFILDFLRAYTEGGVFLLDEGAMGYGALKIINYLVEISKRKTFDLGTYQPGMGLGRPEGVITRSKDFILVIAQNPADSNEGRMNLSHEVVTSSLKMWVDNVLGKDDAVMIIDHYLGGEKDKVDIKVKEKIALLHNEFVKSHPFRYELSPRQLIRIAKIAARASACGADLNKAIFAGVMLSYMSRLPEAEFRDEWAKVEKIMGGEYSSYLGDWGSRVKLGANRADSFLDWLVINPSATSGNIGRKDMRIFESMPSESKALRQIILSMQLAEPVALLAEDGADSYDIVKKASYITGYELETMWAHEQTTRNHILYSVLPKFKSAFNDFGIKEQASGEEFKLRAGFLLSNMMTKEEYDRESARGEPHKHKILYFSMMDSVPERQRVLLNDILTRGEITIQDETGRQVLYKLPEWIHVVVSAAEDHKFSSAFINRFVPVRVSSIMSYKPREIEGLIRSRYNLVRDDERSWLWQVCASVKNDDLNKKFGFKYGFSSQDILKLAETLHLEKARDIKNGSYAARPYKEIYYFLKAVYLVYYAGMAPEDREKFEADIFKDLVEGVLGKEYKAEAFKRIMTKAMDDITRSLEDEGDVYFNRVELDMDKLDSVGGYILPSGIMVKRREGMLFVTTPAKKYEGIGEAALAGAPVNGIRLSEGVSLRNDAASGKTYLDLKLIGSMGGVNIPRDKWNADSALPESEVGTDKFIKYVSQIRRLASVILRSWQRVEVFDGQVRPPRTVFINGETGTAKTSFIRNLAVVWGVPLYTINADSELKVSDMTVGMKMEAGKFELGIKEFLARCGTINGKRIKIPNKSDSNRKILLIDEANATKEILGALMPIMRGEKRFSIYYAGEKLDVELDSEVLLVFTFNPAEKYSARAEIPREVSAYADKIWAPDPMDYSDPELMEILRVLYARGINRAQRDKKGEKEEAVEVKIAAEGEYHEVESVPVRVATELQHPPVEMTITELLEKEITDGEIEKEAVEGMGPSSAEASEGEHGAGGMGQGGEKTVKEVDYDKQKIEDSARAIVEGRESGALYFARNVMHDYLLALTNGLKDKKYVDLVNEAARKIDPEIEAVVDKIRKIYSERQVMSTDLKEALFELRRTFVKHDVYVFMFLLKKPRRAFVETFAEKIERDKEFSMRKEHFEKIGLVSDGKERLYLEPDGSVRDIRAFILEGNEYTEEGSLAYFEGEYAVVFRSSIEKSVAPPGVDKLEPTRWAAWHEMGHVVDQMRNRRARMNPDPDPFTIPNNGEQNSMLFPLIFSEYSREYLKYELFRRLTAAPNPEDKYWQACKGIFNGIIKISGLEGELGGYIEDSFDPVIRARALALLQIITDNRDGIFTSGYLNDIAAVMYKDPVNYLWSVGKGKIRGKCVRGEDGYESILQGVDGSSEIEMEYVDGEDGLEVKAPEPEDEDGTPEYIDEPAEGGWGEGGEEEGEEHGEEGMEHGAGGMEKGGEEEGKAGQPPVKPPKRRKAGDPKIGKVIVSKPDVTGPLARIDRMTRSQVEKWLEIFTGRPIIVPIPSEEGDEPVIEKVAEQDPECFKREVTVRPKASISCGITVDISGSTGYRDEEGRCLLDRFMEMTTLYTSLLYGAAKSNNEVEFSLGAVGDHYYNILDFKRSRDEKAVRAAVKEVESKSKVDGGGINTLSVLDGIRDKYKSQRSKKNKLEIIFTDGGECCGMAPDDLRKEIRKVESELGISIVFVGIGVSAADVKEYPTYLHLQKEYGDKPPDPAEMLRVIMGISRLKVRGRLSRERDIGPLLGYERSAPEVKHVTDRVRSYYASYLAMATSSLMKVGIANKYLRGAWWALNLSQLVFHEPGHLMSGAVKNIKAIMTGEEKLSLRSAAVNTARAIWRGEIDKPLPAFADKYGGIIGNITGLLIGGGLVVSLSYLAPGALTIFFVKAISSWIMIMNTLELSAQLVSPGSDLNRPRTTNHEPRTTSAAPHRFDPETTAKSTQTASGTNIIETQIPIGEKPEKEETVVDKAAGILRNILSMVRFPSEKTVIYLPSVKDGTFGEEEANKRLMGVYKKLRDKARDGYDMRNITVRFYDDGYFETSRKGEGLVLAEKIREDTRDPGSRVFIYSREERYDAVKGAIPEALTERVTAVREKVTNELSLTMVHTRVALAVALLTIKRNDKDTGDLTNNILSLFELLGGEDTARAIREDKDALKKILSGALLIELKPFSEEIGEQMEAIEAVATSL
ncbi:MAG: AAA family ATPase [Candidatus Omnitrophica bacterium]|nr:AAA family ATPase [Candidatus Omnitrophota bacterium]